MDTTTSTSFRHRKPSPSDRFLGSRSQLSQSPSFITTCSLELDEDEIFYSSGDTSENQMSSNSHRSKIPVPTHNSSFRTLTESSGILAALSEDNNLKRTQLRRSMVYRPLISSEKLIPITSKPYSPSEHSYSVSMNHSAPVNVPILSKAMADAISKRKNTDFYEEDDLDGEEEMLPPHEIVARGSARSQLMTFSVLEGPGRTLKGRDLRVVRNAVLQKTGFLD